MHERDIVRSAVFGKLLRATAQREWIFAVKRKPKMLDAELVKGMYEPPARARDSVRNARVGKRSGDFDRPALHSALPERRKNLENLHATDLVCCSLIFFNIIP
jgi:hypothetical protein